MTDLQAFIEAHWELVFLLVGGVLLLGAIFGWGFAVTPDRWEDRYSFHFIPWRLKIGASGALLVALGLLLLFWR